MASYRNGALRDELGANPTRASAMNPAVKKALRALRMFAGVNRHANGYIAGMTSFHRPLHRRDKRDAVGGNGDGANYEPGSSPFARQRSTGGLGVSAVFCLRPLRRAATTPADADRICLGAFCRGRAMLLSKPAITAPIVGATKLHQLDDTLASVNVKLSVDEITSLEEPYVPHAVVGFI